MIQTRVSLIALLLLCLIPVFALAQDNKPADPNPAPAASSPDGEKPKDEVAQMLDAAKKRGETVLGVCLDECRDNPNAIVGDELVRGRVLELPKPTYPSLARAARAEGTVEVRVIIDEEGKVIAAAAVSGHPLLHAASVQAARNSLFTPTKLDGKPVKVTGVLQYNFVPMQ